MLVDVKYTGQKWRVLDLFAGLRGWTSAFDDLPNWEVVTTDIDERFDVTFHADVLELTADALNERFGGFDLVLASPPCEKFSVASLSKYWWVLDDCRNCGNEVRLVKRTHGKGGAQTWEHVDEVVGQIGCWEPHAVLKREPRIAPKNDEARYYSRLVEHTMQLIRDLAPSYWVMENPSGMMKRLPVLADVERREISYCRYGMTYMKPTTLWGGFPPSLKLHPVCQTRKNKANPRQGQEVIDPETGWVFVTNERGEPCHEKAERGAKTGIQRLNDYAKKSLIPRGLSLAVAAAAEADLAS